MIGKRGAKMRENELPLLEYDDDKHAVFMPNYDNLQLRLPPKAVFAFLGSEIDHYAQSQNAKIAANFVSATKSYPIYLLQLQGTEVCLVQAPVGAPAAVQIFEWLIAYEVKEVISAGSCGVLVDWAENSFLIPVEALRDEGTSYHYLPPARSVSVSRRAVDAIRQTLQAHNLPYHEVKTWTTDGFFRETEAKVERRKAEGCQVVEMECAALAACAQMREIVWGEILYTADTLHDPANYDGRSWGEDSIAPALQLCLEAVLKI